MIQVGSWWVNAGAPSGAPFSLEALARNYSRVVLRYDFRGDERRSEGVTMLRSRERKTRMR